MQQPLTTQRLSLVPLTATHATFIRELVNTPGWLQFIGDRKVNDIDAALAYINRINTTPGIQYWVVSLVNSDIPVGLITLIQRNYLPCQDIGFAFLPAHSGQGYAFESSMAVLEEIKQHTTHQDIAAITIPGNTASIRLLEKLGLRFEREIAQDGETLLVYTRSLC